jgi:hypothetical protein
VKLDVGDWTRTLKIGANGRVQYTLMNSRNPVVQVDVMFNNELQDRLSGSDLRKVAGSYFFGGNVAGRFDLTVVARDAFGCSDGATRPMTVTVK